MPCSKCGSVCKRCGASTVWMAQARGAHALRKMSEAERVLARWAAGHDAVLARAAAKLLRRLSEVGS